LTVEDGKVTDFTHIQEVPSASSEPDWDVVLESKPELEKVSTSDGVREYSARQYNYAAREDHNRKLGERGEFVLQLERRRLATSGRTDLAEEVQWISKTRGDGAGYDVRSFDTATEQELFIEVKTANSGKYQPFFMISDNEVAFSEEYQEQYSLYRVFQFKSDARIYTLEGNIRRHVNLLVREYTATFR
jgi:hypothetical protein